MGCAASQKDSVVVLPNRSAVGWNLPEASASAFVRQKEAMNFLFAAWLASPPVGRSRRCPPSSGRNNRRTTCLVVSNHRAIVKNSFRPTKRETASVSAIAACNPQTHVFEDCFGRPRPARCHRENGEGFVIARCATNIRSSRPAAVSGLSTRKVLRMQFLLLRCIKRTF